jgi:hypothetical protein
MKNTKRKNAPNKAKAPLPEKTYSLTLTLSEIREMSHAVVEYERKVTEVIEAQKDIPQKDRQRLIRECFPPLPPAFTNAARNTSRCPK